MDASSDDDDNNELNNSKIGEPPVWLFDLTNKAIETNKQRDFERKKKLLDDGYLTPADQVIRGGIHLSSDRKDKEKISPLQKDMIDLKLTIFHRANMVKTDAELPRMPLIWVLQIKFN